MKLPKWFKREKDPYTRQELAAMFEDCPDYVIDFVYDSFYMGAVVTLSYLGTPEFSMILDEYAAFVDYVAGMTDENRVNDEELRDTLIRAELQSLLDQAAKKPDE